MVEWKYTIQDPEGFHARLAPKFVVKTMKFNSNTRASLYQNSTDAESILEMMALGTGRNDKILVRASGEDEEEALEAVKQVLVQENDLNS